MTENDQATTGTTTPETGAPGERRTDTAPGDEDETTRRWWIRLMIALAIGIPIAIESGTLIGLVDQHFLGGDDGGDGNGAGDGTDTPVGGVGVGDDLLAGTDRTERIADAFISTRGGTRTFTLAVSVENTGDRPYRLTLGDLRTDDGTRVAGERSTDPIAPGESSSAVARWDLPGGAAPREVHVEGAVLEDGTAVDTVEEWVRLSPVAIR